MLTSKSHLCLVEALRALRAEMGVDLTGGSTTQYIVHPTGDVCPFLPRTHRHLSLSEACFPERVKNAILSLDFHDQLTTRFSRGASQGRTLAKLTTYTTGTADPARVSVDLPLVSEAHHMCLPEGGPRPPSDSMQCDLMENVALDQESRQRWKKESFPGRQSDFQKIFSQLHNYCAAAFCLGDAYT